ncbi:MAG: aminodeoxychorismate lyase [Sulfuriferula sp.]|nr:aminodeoxychorismate lyase [Sulfuriferula sp.]
MILVDGYAADKIAVTDRGLSYGDGVFRTLRMVAGRVQNWHLHYAKLADDCARLALACPDKTLFEQDIAQFTGHHAGVIKLMVTRGDGLRGYAPPAMATPTRISMISALPHVDPARLSVGISARWCQLRLAHQPRLAGIKHLNRLENVLARAEWQDAAIAEGLLLDVAGNVIGGTMSNVFIVNNGVLSTPDLALCGIAGVTRARVLAYAKQLNWQVRITQLSQEAILAADEVMVVNSVIGIWQIRTLADKNWAAGSVTPLLRAYLEGDND